MYAIDPGQYGTASDMAAGVAQAQYDNWKETYYPAALASRDMTTYANSDVLPTEIAKGTAIATGNVDNAVQQQKQMYERVGINPNAQQQQAMDRSASLGKSTSVVDAANRIRQTLIDRNKSIMGSNVTSFQARV